MNKRIKKKYGNTYPLVKKAKRQASKRKGPKCLEHTLIPFGEKDRHELALEGWMGEMKWATHWFVRLHEVNAPYFFEQRIYYRIDVYFSTINGGTKINWPYYMNFYKENDEAFVRSKWELITYTMKTDQFLKQLSMQ